MSSILRLGHTDWMGYAPLVLAGDLGLLAGKGIEICELESKTRDEKFLSGELDCVAMSLNSFCRIAPHVESRAVLALVEVKPPGSERIVAQTRFSSLAQLQEGRVSYVRHGLEHFYLHYFFSDAGLRLPELVEARNRVEMVEHLRGGLADAAVLYEPFISQFVNGGNHRVISVDADLSVIAAVLTVRMEAMREKSDELRCLMTAFLTAVDYLRSRPTESHTRLLRYYRVDNADPMSSMNRQLEGMHYPDLEENRLLMSAKLARAIDVSNTVWQQIGVHEATLAAHHLLEPALIESWL